MIQDTDLFIWAKKAWLTYRKNFMRVVLPNIFLSFVSNVLLIYLGRQYYKFVWLFLGTLLSTGYMFYCLRILRQETSKVEDLLVGIKRFWIVWSTSFIAAVITFIGTLALIIPGIILMAMFSMSILAVVDKNLPPLKALMFSKKVTEGHRIKLILLIFILLLLSILQIPFRSSLGVNTKQALSILAIILYLFSVLVTVPFGILFHSAAYDDLTKRIDQKG